jgi:CRP-like cAMP-binding protein
LLINGLARHFFVTPTGRKVYLLWLSPGETFGGVSILEEPSTYLVSTEVVKGSDVLVWTRDSIRNLAEQYPRILENGLATAVDYLAWFLASHLSLVCNTAKERLAHVVFSLAKGIGENRSDGIHLEVTNEQLANTANITLFTVSRYLNTWQRSGVLLKQRGKIILRSPKRLFS